MQRLDMPEAGSRLLRFLVMALTVGMILVAVAMVLSSGAL